MNEVKRELYCLFSSVAPVVEINMKSGMKTRGQAWISFANAEAANIVMSQLQGMNFLGKELHIEFAKSRSKVLTDYSAPTKEQEDYGPSEIEFPQNPDCRVLRVTGYPPMANEVVLSILFRQCKGFERIETTGDHALAFYNTSEDAMQAMRHLQGFVVVPGSGYNLRVDMATDIKCL
jgi:RNA recognition motif-containing protein